MDGRVRWEYKFEDESDTEVDDFNELGSEGWELVTLTPYGDSPWGISVFKRPYKLCRLCGIKVVLGTDCEDCGLSVE